MGKNKQLQIELQEGFNQFYEEEAVPEVKNNDELSDAQIHQRYYKWLCAPLLSEKKKRYLTLLTRLYSIDFTWTVPNDGNRVSDGEKLRERFLETNNLGFYEWSVLSKKTCSVLEMIIGICVRITDIMEDEREPNSWFWELLDNLGLTEYSDDVYYSAGGMIFVKDIITNFVHRNYTFEGNGGLFPLSKSNKDQRKVEIWYQMQQYLQDKHNAVT